MKWKPETLYVGDDITLETKEQSNIDAMLFNQWDNERALNPNTNTENQLWKLNLEDYKQKYNNNKKIYTETKKKISGKSEITDYLAFKTYDTNTDDLKPFGGLITMPESSHDDVSYFKDTLRMLL
jgi:hypothetical protein